MLHRLNTNCIAMTSLETSQLTYLSHVEFNARLRRLITATNRKILTLAPKLPQGITASVVTDLIHPKKNLCRVASSNVVHKSRPEKQVEHRRHDTETAAVN